MRFWAGFGGGLTAGLYGTGGGGGSTTGAGASIGGGGSVAATGSSGGGGGSGSGGGVSAGGGGVSIWAGGSSGFGNEGSNATSIPPTAGGSGTGDSLAGSSRISTAKQAACPATDKPSGRFISL